VTNGETERTLVETSRGRRLQTGRYSGFGELGAAVARLLPTHDSGPLPDVYEDGAPRVFMCCAGPPPSRGG